MKKRAGLLVIFALLAIFLLPTFFLRPSSEKAYANGGTDYSAYSSITNFVINTQEDFASFATFYNAKATYNFSGKTVTLNCDIDLASVNMLFSNFYGTFLGNGHKIYNQTKPLFAAVGTKNYLDAVISDIAFVNAANTVEYLLADSSYGAISNIFYWGNFTPINISSSMVFRGIIKNNFGQLNNVINFGKITAVRNAKISGICENNYGVIGSCHFFGDIDYTAYSDTNCQIALIAYNNYILNNTVSPALPSLGQINDSSAVANIVFTTVSTPVNQLYIRFLYDNYGTLSRSYAISAISNTSGLTVNKGLIFTARDGSNVYSSYFAFGSDFGVYDASGTSLFFTANWKDYLIEEYLGSNYYYYSDIYPVNKAFYPASGDSEVNSIILSNASDIYKLRVFNGLGTVYAKMAFDCNLKSMPLIKRLSSNTVSINYDGQYYAFYKSSNENIFDSSFIITANNLGCLATATAKKIAASYADGSNVYYDADGFNYGYVGGALSDIVPSASLLGAGTRVSPYLISSASDLAYLDGITGYALLTNDIVINSPTNFGNILALSDLNVTLLGGGHSIIGLLLPLSQNIYGSVSSVFFRGYLNDYAGGLICDYNYGTIKNVVVSGTATGVEEGALVARENHSSVSFVECFGSVSTEFSAGCVYSNYGVISNVKNYASVETFTYSSSGIASINSGTITLSINYGSADYGITASQEGIISNTVNMGVSNFADAITGISSSINKTISSYALINNLTVESHQTLDYLTMKNNPSYNMTNIFGYEVNTSLDYPVLREEGKKYKTEVVNPFRTYSFSNKVFNVNTSYLIEDIELYVVTGATASSQFSWQYNGASYFEESLHNAGTYVMTVNYGGSDLYLPAIKVQSFVIAKATPPLALSYDSFPDLSATYNGSFYVVSTPDPTNIADITSYGYSQTHVFSKDGVTIDSDEIIAVGTYSQAIIFSSTNYYDLNIERDITISRAPLSLILGDYSVDYLEEIDKNELTYSLQGLVSLDSGKTLLDLVGASYADYFDSDYLAGNDVGFYEISYSLGQTANYYFVVTVGQLTVSPIDLAQGSISFYNATNSNNGSYETFYNGYIQALSASNVPDGVSVSYLSNQNKDVGYYYPKAVFSKPNYNSLQLTVYLEIKKIPLTVNVIDKVVSYGYEVNTSDFEAGSSGLVGEDTIIGVFDQRPFVYSVYDGETLKESGEKLNSADYTIELSIGGAAVSNYNVSIEFGTLYVGKVYLTTLYNNNGEEASDFDDYDHVFDNTPITRTIGYFLTNGIDVTINYEYYEGETLLETSSVTDAGTYTVVATAVPTGNAAINYITTVYQCAIIIDKQQLSIAMEQETYQFVYGATNYGVEENFAYTGFVPLGTEVNFNCTKDDIASPGINAGEYVISFSVPESKNYYGCVAQADLIIAPKEITADVEESYTYTGRAIIPEVTLDGAINDEITLSDISFVYKNAANNVVANITAVGSYTVTLGIINNTNYVLDTGVFSITVSPYNMYFAWGEMEFVYGTLGDFTYGERVYNITSTRITLKNFLVTALNNTIDISVNFNSTVSGIFYLEESDIIRPINYNVYFTSESKASQLNKISITKRPLNVIWKIDNNEYYNQSYEGSYTGLPQSLRWTYGLSNFAFSDSISNVEILTQVLGDGEEILHVGNYTLILTILNNLNYTLVNNSIAVKVVKAELRIVINDATIEQGESYVYPSLSVSGRRGSDTNKAIELLDGANIRMITDYSVTSPAGSHHNINVNATFRNYYAVVTRQGTLSVVANPYPDYNLSDKIFVYNGQDRTVVLENVPSEINIVYSNNVHKDAGVYTVSAVITYPSGRIKISNCTLTIIKATPILELQPNTLIFTPNRLLMPSDIIGTAKHSGASIQGSLQFEGEWYLREGEYTYYEVAFIPEDIQNYNAVNSFYTISSVQIDYSALVFNNPLDFTFTSDTTATITAQVEVTLKNVIEGLSLYLGGYKVDSIVLNKSGTISFQIRYGGDIVYGATWEITFVDINNPEETVIDSSMLDFSGAKMNSDTINVDLLGGRISLSEEYKDKYLLYVNGIMLDEYILNGNEESIIIMIKSKTIDNLTLFAKEYKIETVVVEEPINKRDYKIYYIVGGSILGAAAVVGLIILIRRRKKGY